MFRCKGLPVQARTDGDTISFAIDDRMYTIGLSRKGSKPAQETGIPRQVVETVEECGGDLAGC